MSKSVIRKTTEDGHTIKVYKDGIVGLQPHEEPHSKYRDAMNDVHDRLRELRTNWPPVMGGGA